MIDPKKLEQLARQVLQNQFSRMDLVSREEFDVQTQVLLRTREKLSQLELRLNALETMPKSDPLASPAAPAGAAAGAKPAGVSGVDDTTSVSPAEQAVPEGGSVDDKPAKDTFKKL